jgi:hypothetical protein
MAAGSTYTPIATSTVSTASSYTFSSIPSTYTDLIVVFGGVASGLDTMAFRFNGDTGTNYSDTVVGGDGSSAYSNRRTNQTLAYYGTPSTSQSTVIGNIFNYANTTTFKTSLGRGNTTSSQVESRVNLWRSTAAINSVTILCGGGSTLTGTFTLYGIAAA